jgi:uncharacterized membrane protein YkvA (DUF1232 family)
MRRAAALKALWAAVSGRRRPGGPSLGEQVAAVPRLVLMTVSGRYPGMSRGRLGLLALGVLYVVAPIDLVPEAALWLVGLGDDAVVLAWLAGTLLSETDAYLQWEADRRVARQRDDVVPGEVIR